MKPIRPKMNRIQPTLLTSTDPGFVGWTASARMSPTAAMMRLSTSPMAGVCPISDTLEPGLRTRFGLGEQRVAAVDDDRLAAHHVGVRRAQERDRAGDVVGLDQPADRVRCSRGQHVLATRAVVERTRV